MSSRRVTSPVGLICALAFVCLATIPLAGQQPVLRTPWGHPDLQGVWNAATLTPLERPDNVGGRLTLTPAGETSCAARG